MAIKNCQGQLHRPPDITQVGKLVVVVQDKQFSSEHITTISGPDIGNYQYQCSIYSEEHSSEPTEKAGPLRGHGDVNYEQVTMTSSSDKESIEYGHSVLHVLGKSILTAIPQTHSSDPKFESTASESGKQSVGNDSHSTKEGNNYHNKDTQQKHQQTGACGDNSCDPSLPSSGGSGDGRGGDDGNQNNGNRKKKEFILSSQEEEEKKDEDSKKQKEDKEEMKESEESGKKLVEGDATTVTAEEEKHHKNVRGDSCNVVDTDTKKRENEVNNKACNRRRVSQNSNSKEHQQPTYINIPQCIGEACRDWHNERNGLTVRPTEYSRSGDYYLRHLQKCCLGHLHCEACRLYLDSFIQLLSNLEEECSATMYSFLSEYMKSTKKEDKYCIILKWLNATRTVEECRLDLKRLHLSNSTSQGARPKKKIKYAGSSSNEPMDTTTTPSPDESRWGFQTRPKVVHGTRQDLDRWARMNMSMNDATDCRVNDGVLLNRNLYPCEGCYRPTAEFTQLKQLGSGSSGEVCLAEDNSTSQKFVCKCVNIEQYDINEVLVWKRLDHPRIVPLWGVVRDGNYIYMLSKFIPSNPIPTRIANSDLSISDAEVVNYIQQILEVLVYIHSLNIVHMDIKPGNLLLTDNGIVLIDWGLSANLNDNGVLRLQEARGTEVFMAPEVVCCESFNAAVDIWSLMCTAIQLFTGLPPWMNRFPQLFTYQLVIGKYPPPLEDIPETLDPAIRTFLKAGLEADFHNRPTAHELLGNPIFSMDSFTRLPTQHFNAVQPTADEMEYTPIPPPDEYIDDVAMFPALGEEEAISVSVESILKTHGSVNRKHHHQEDCTPGLDSSITSQQLQESGCHHTSGATGRYQYREDRLEDELSESLRQLQISDDEDLYGPGSPNFLDQEPIDESEHAVPSNSSDDHFHCLYVTSEQPPVNLFDANFPDLGSPYKLSELSNTSDVTRRRLSSYKDIAGSYSGSDVIEHQIANSASPEKDKWSYQNHQDEPSGGQLNRQRKRNESRRSSSHSSVFEHMFPDLGSMAASSADELSTAEEPSERSLSTPHVASCCSSIPARNVKEDYHESDTAGSSPPTDFGKKYTPPKVDNGTSGYVSEATAQPHNSERRRTSSANHIVSINVLGQVIFAFSSTLYGNLAEGISQEVYKIFKAKHIPISRFILTDEHGEQFDENNPVDPSIEVRVAIACDEDKWTWCVTPEN
ncbi:uncharacterized protein [Antedon mediterranea]|uniref:uncharacterized protein isoform X2 n=1 Tax=Antedon mediterranea TaxID=105859 RepID=UPI003AF636AE